MSTAPTVPASPSRILDHALVGELSTALCVYAGHGTGESGACFAVNYGREGHAIRAWSSVEFPFTADGERAARAKFAALVAAADVVQA